MNILQKAAIKLFRLEKAAGFSTNQSYEILNGQIISSADNKQNYLNKGFNINDTIYSIVRLIVDKVRVAPWGVYKVVDEPALKQYQSLISKKNLSGSDFIKARDLRKKALEPFDGDGRLNELLKYPNEEQTMSDLVADGTIYKLLTGDRLLWAELLSAGANTGKPHSLHLLPSQDISIVVTKDFPLKIIGYKLDKWGLLDFPKASILHDKYYNPNHTVNGDHLLGLAPMKAALALTDRSNSENRAATMAYQNGGPRSIIFVDEPAFDPGQRGAEAAAIKRVITSKEYVGANNNNKLASTGYKMGVVPLGLSPVDLDIIESEKWSLRRFCNVFGGVPSQLLNDPDNKVYNNSVEGEKALTSRCALPLLSAFRDKLNQKFQTDWGYKGKNVYADYDMNVYTELQEDLAKKWGYVKELPTTNRRKLEMMGEDAPDGHDEFMDQILIPSSYELSDGFGQTDTDAALAAGDEEVSETAE